MAKKKYVVKTAQTITKTWEYEIENDSDLIPEDVFMTEAMDIIYEDGIEGHCLSDGEVISEEVISIFEQGESGL